MTEVETELSRFVAETNWDALPEAIRNRVNDIWADTVANALAGRRAANTPAVESLAARLTGPGDSVVIGGASSSMTGAALINGFQITAFTMCDVYRPALCHITPEVVPVLLALADDGRDLLVGLAVGLELTARLGLGLDYPTFRGRGWHAPGVIGTIGAAAAGARVLGLDHRQIRAAMGLGASQASGTFAALGTAAVKFHQARGAVSGLWAALFAADGLGGSQRGLTHPDGGVLTTYTDGGRPDLILDGLGERWELEQISLRRWPAASSLQSLVAGLLDFTDVGTESVRSAQLELPPSSYAMCAEMGWEDELSAMQSARYVTAAVLADRRCWTEQFSAERRVDPAINQFASDVSVRQGTDLPPSGVRIRLTRTDGTVVETTRDTAPGEPSDPLTRPQIIDKLQAAAVTTPVSGGDLVRVVYATDGCDGASVRAALCAPTAERSEREYAQQH
ncbi:MmgE/PrpD family protein [Mycolicibacterium wolinskyi]|uniref:MmgE/PrpD family protein n=1 Tax=Mycolicibacterium wolinskyi TaxID=59750 RepID=UPI003917ACD6